MPPDGTGVGTGKAAGYTRRRNMKKVRRRQKRLARNALLAETFPAHDRPRSNPQLNRAGRARLKKRKEVVAAAEASGDDVNEALRKAGLLDEYADERAGDAVAGEDRGGKDGADDGAKTASKAIKDGNDAKKAKARERIEKLKASKRQKKALEGGGHPSSHQASQNRQATWADALFESFKSATNHAHRASSGFVASAIHPASPVPVTGLERALTQRETRATKLSVPPAETARPKVLYISPSAIGALDCLKNCQGLHAACPIAKLFAKHMKVPEQAAYLREHPVNVALGTPNRLLKLATEGHLDLSAVRVIALDMRKNPKHQSLVDIPDVARDWWRIWEQFLMQRGAGKDSGDDRGQDGAKSVQVLIVDA